METEPQIIERYVATGKVKLIYRHLLQLGAPSVRAAEASECAAEQGMFWELRTALYHRQGELYRSLDTLDTALANVAADLGLDVAAYNDCMQSHKHVEAIQADFRAAEEAGVRSRPVFDINGQRLVGAQPFEAFTQAIGAKITGG